MEKLNLILFLPAMLLVLVLPGLAWPAAFARGGLLLAAASEKGGGPCMPTPADALGPFYQPDAPVRDRVGQGYVLSGAVRSADGCVPLAGARLEFWLAGPDGVYDEEHRATMFSGPEGTYRFESNFPPQYSFRPPHIHLKVSADGFKTLVTQHYPVAGQPRGTMDLVLVPSH